MQIWTDYGDLPRKSPYSVRMRENTNEKNSEYGHLSRSEIFTVCLDFYVEST